MDKPKCSEEYKSLFGNIMYVAGQKILNHCTIDKQVHDIYSGEVHIRIFSTKTGPIVFDDPKELVIKISKQASLKDQYYISLNFTHQAKETGLFSQEIEFMVRSKDSLIRNIVASAFDLHNYEFEAHMKRKPKVCYGAHLKQRVTSHFDYSNNGDI